MTILEGMEIIAGCVSYVYGVHQIISTEHERGIALLMLSAASFYYAFSSALSA